MKFCFLVPDEDENAIRKYYLRDKIKEEDCLFIPLYFDPKKKKTPAKVMQEWFKDEVYPRLIDNQIQYLCICEGEYFKALTKNTKSEPFLGYVLSNFSGSINYLFVPSYKQVFYNPEAVIHKINIALDALENHVNGNYSVPGSNIIKYAEYPDTYEAIQVVLATLHNYKKLTCDIETYSLKHYDSGLGSITFCWNQNEGIAFKIDPDKENKNQEVRQLLKEFFESYSGTLIFHNITFDAYILTYQLYMRDLLDTEGLLKGMSILLKDFEDTKLIAYLATNSCAGNSLSLKSLAQEYAGNYAQEEIGNIELIPTKQLLEYNLIDGLATWYVYNKYWNQMVKDNQLNIYQTIFKPAVKDIIQMQLTGLPMNMERVLEVDKELTNIQQTALNNILKSPIVIEFNQELKEEWAIQRNKELKTKQVTAADCKEDFNPGSNLQLRKLLYRKLKLPVLDTTGTKEAATGKDTLAKLLNHVTEPEVKDLLNNLIDFKDVDKILTAFIPAFKQAQKANDGRYYLYGNFNLGGTLSGRLSSNNPNLQNLPATGTKYAKIIKSCFQAPEGWLWCGLDFASLEAHIDALVTRDNAKLDIYRYGYDLHAYNAMHYKPENTPELKLWTRDEPVDTNGLDPVAYNIQVLTTFKKKYKQYRQLYKSCTFALQYGAQEGVISKNFGFTKEEAKGICANYHKLYKESDKYKEDRIKEASKKGYIDVAFGLRVRTPKLRQSMLGLKVTPYEVKEESKSAGNAIMQSWGLLNTRAGIEFNTKVRNSKYRDSIRPIAQIHDAQYFLIKDDIETILWANENLVKACQWQKDPLIYDDTVKLGGNLSIFYPDWAHELELPNQLDRDILLSLVQKYQEELKNG